jgi:hypothetical protein
MNATLNTRQLRLVGILALVVVVAGAYLVTQHKSSTSNTTSSTPAVTTPAHTTPSPTKSHAHTATPVRLGTRGLPVQVAKALRKHSVVVVSLYMPGAAVDEVTAAEAHAGAVAMGVPFVSVNVFKQRPGTNMLRKLGVVNTPVVLVIKRPANVYSEFKGLIDQSVVEQAVADAR